MLLTEPEILLSLMQHEWEIWLDNHLSPILAKWLSDETGYSIKSAYSLQLYQLNDKEIYQKAREHGKVILISKDSDLDEIISLLGSPPKLISLRIGNCDNKKLYEILKSSLPKAIRLLFDFKKDIIEINNNYE